MEEDGGNYEGIGLLRLGGTCWRAIIMVILIWQLDWATGCLVNCYFWVSMRVSLEKISICIHGLNKADDHPQRELVSSNSRRAWIEQQQKSRWVWNLLSAPLPKMGHLSFAYSAPGPQAFRPTLGSTLSATWLSGLRTTPPVFLGLQLADSRWWEFSTSIAMWTNTI